MQSVRRPQSDCPTHTETIRLTNWSSGRRETEGEKLAAADGSKHEAASKYRQVEKSKWQSYSSDLMWPCERSAADTKTVNREAIDGHMAQCACVRHMAKYCMTVSVHLCACFLKTKIYCQCKPSEGCRVTDCWLHRWFAGFCYDKYLFGHLKKIQSLILKINSENCFVTGFCLSRCLFFFNKVMLLCCFFRQISQIVQQ